MSDRTRLRRPVLLGIVGALLLPAAGYAQDWRTVAKSRQFSGEAVLHADIEYAAGTLRMSPAASGTLYQVSVRYDEDAFVPGIAYERGRLSVEVEHANTKHDDMKAGVLDVRLGPDVPIELDLRFGAARAELELGGLRIRNAAIATGASTTRINAGAANPEICRQLKIEVGAARLEAVGIGNLNAETLQIDGGVGEVVLDFTGEWQRNLSGSVSIGLGGLTLKVPREIGLRINRGGLLSAFDGPGLIRRGDRYMSENWDSAEHRLSLDIDAALGSVRVVWLDSQK